jgi:hypothetical protein
MVTTAAGFTVIGAMVTGVTVTGAATVTTVDDVLEHSTFIACCLMPGMVHSAPASTM